MKVALNDSEERLARRLAAGRSESDTQKQDQKIGEKADFDTDYIGVIAEIAAAKALNVYPDLHLDGPEDVDVIIPTKNGSTCSVDVKATEHEDGHLLAPTWKQYRNPADIFMLGIVERSGEKESCQLVGWVWAEDLFTDDNIKNFGYGPTFGMSESELEPMDKLI